MTGVGTPTRSSPISPNPNKFLGGPSKMVFKLPDEKERKDVIAYVSQFDIDGKKKPEPEGRVRFRRRRLGPFDDHGGPARG